VTAVRIFFIGCWIIAATLFCTLSAQPYKLPEKPLWFSVEPKISGVGKYTGIVQDNQGVIYIGSSMGIIIYDGYKWRKIETLEPVLTLAYDSVENRVLVGGNNLAGYIHTHSPTRYHNLLGQFAQTGKFSGDITHIIPTADGIWFSDGNLLWKLENNQIRQILPHINGINGIASHRELLYFNIPGKGLHVWKDTLFKVPGGEELQQTNLEFAVPISPFKLLAATKDTLLGLRFFEISTSGIKNIKLRIPPHLGKPDISAETKALPDGKIAIATENMGILIFNPQTNEFEIAFNTYTGFPSNNIAGICIDRTGGCWVSYPDGLYRILLHLPIIDYSSEKCSVGKVYAVAYVNNQYYIGAEKGVFKLAGSFFKTPPAAPLQKSLPKDKPTKNVRKTPAKNKTKIVKKVSGVTTNIHSEFTQPVYIPVLEGQGTCKQLITLANGQLLAVIENKGVYALNNNTNSFTRIGWENKPQLSLIASEIHPNRVYVWRPTEVGIIYWEQGQWKKTPITPLPENRYLRSVAEHLPDKLIATTLEGTIHISFTANKAGFQDLERDSSEQDFKLLRLAGWVFRNIEDNFYIINKEGKTIREKETRSTATIPATIQQLANELNTATLVLAGANLEVFAKKNEKLCQYKIVNNQLIKNNLLLLGRWHDSYTVACHTRDGKLLLSNNKGIMVFPVDSPAKFSQFNVSIKSIYLKKWNGDSLERAGEGNVFNYINDWFLEAEAAAPYYDAENAVEYSYTFIHDGDTINTNFNTWQKNPVFTFAGSKHAYGVYELWVRARNPQGNIAQIVAATFEILPPWYYSAKFWWPTVILTVGFLGFALVYGIRTIRQAQRTANEAKKAEAIAKNELIEKNRRLENSEIALLDKTHKLEAQTIILENQKAKLQQQTEELTKQNEEIIRQRDELAEKEEALKKYLMKLGEAQAELKKSNQELIHSNAELEQRNAEIEKKRTELQHAYDELKATRQQLQESEQLAIFGKLAATAAHRINSPLAAIRGTAESFGAQTQDLVQKVLINIRQLNARQWDFFSQIAQLSLQKNINWTPQEERNLRNKLEQHLENCGILKADILAQELIKLRLSEPSDINSFETALKAADTLQIVKDTAILCGFYHQANRIRLSSDNISQILEGLRAFTESNQQKGDGFSQCEIDIKAALTKFLDTQKSKLQNAGIQLITDFDPDLPHLIGSPSLLEHVWSNLLSNAIQAIRFSQLPPGTNGKIFIEAHQMQQGNIEIRFTDNGHGIPPEIGDRIFDAFFTTRREGDSNGLGLALCKKIIEHDHHGKISYTSEAGATVFVVRLPTRT
jgi:signal transduction histidine kinase